MYPGQFNLHIIDKNAVINRPQNALYNKPYVLKLRNQSVFQDQIQQGKDVLTDSYLSQSSEQSQHQLMKSKLQEIENLSLKQRNEFLSQKINEQQKELSKLWKLCQNHLLPPVTQSKQNGSTDSEFQDSQFRNGFETRRAESYEYQYSPRYDNQSDSISYRQTTRKYKKHRIQQKNSVDLQNQSEKFSYLHIPASYKKPTYKENKLPHRKKRYRINTSRLKSLFFIHPSLYQMDKKLQAKKKSKNLRIEINSLEVYKMPLNYKQLKCTNLQINNQKMDISNY
ncbi:unnamed protein product [Paramecium octaurelia]|uniref:Uncharacterized protein n=1 Tax=Paramecium octaurelia TaxID=43137 RepID=A0A8S1T6F2_PAROT|nr:unnamed protein product [Paramecium octaurelia]